MLDTVGSVDQEVGLLSAVTEELRMVVEGSVSQALGRERDHLSLRAGALRHSLQLRASKIQRQMLALSVAVLHMEEMNELSYTLALSSEEAGQAHNLKRRWACVTEDAMQRFSELQAAALQQESFTERCERAVQLLDRMEKGLAVEIAGGYQQLQEQQKTHELFQAELSIAHQILDSVVEEAVRLLQRGEVEDRLVFVEMLNQLRERWTAVGLRVWQQKVLVSSLVCQWRCYNTNQRQLCYVLAGMGRPLSLTRNHNSCSLRDLCTLLEDTKVGFSATAICSVHLGHVWSWGSAQHI
uniref:Uncharacterized protein n=1 Tax=Callorhinchus milii TaxID=7868 RepID=A0A4W3H9I7_CALMI